MNENQPAPNHYWQHFNMKNTYEAYSPHRLDARLLISHPVNGAAERLHTEHPLRHQIPTTRHFYLDHKLLSDDRMGTKQHT